jgi:hypothetical protein
MLFLALGGVMLYQTVFSLIFTFGSFFAQAESINNLNYRGSEELRSLIGHTFLSPGPNCFAAALYGVGGISKFRGVSANEFSRFVEGSCIEVHAPQYGDIGYYFVDGFGPSHAFFYLNQEMAFEKPGVDYLGATSLNFRRISDIHYIRIATPECRRWGNEDCYSQFKYVRCGNKPESSKTFQRVLLSVEMALDAKLNRNQDLTEETLSNVSELSEIAGNDYERAVVESLEKQLDFF